MKQNTCNLLQEISHITEDGCRYMFTACKLKTEQPVDHGKWHLVPRPKEEEKKGLVSAVIILILILSVTLSIDLSQQHRACKETLSIVLIQWPIWIHKQMCELLWSWLTRRGYLLVKLSQEATWDFIALPSAFLPEISIGACKQCKDVGQGAESG